MKPVTGRELLKFLQSLTENMLDEPIAVTDGEESWSLTDHFVMGWSGSEIEENLELDDDMPVLVFGQVD